MRFIQTFSILLAGVFATACATTAPPVTSTQRVSTDYVVVGQAGDANAYVYGNVTVLEFKQVPDALVVRDETGAVLALEKIGSRFRMQRKVENFTADINGVTCTFVFSASAAPQARAKPRHADYQPVATAAVRPATPAAAPAPAPAAELTQYQLLPSDISLRGTVARWAKLEGWSLVWDLPPTMDAKITNTSSFTAASLPAALGVLLDGLRAKGYSNIGVNLYSDRVIHFTQTIQKP